MTEQITITTLDDVRALLRNLPGPDEAALAQASEREPNLTKPTGSLGRLEELCHWATAWQRSYPPRAETIHCHVFAGNHGIAAKGVSAFPPDVTTQMVESFRHGRAAINQLCNTFGIEIAVHPLHLEQPVADFTEVPAMSDAQCAEAIAYGMRTVEASADLVILGEMGIGNTTSASAIAHALFGETPELWVGRGSGINDTALERKLAVVRDGVARHRAAMTDPLEVLRHLGGWELAAIAGAVIGARLKGVPVMLDGLICTAAAAPLELQQSGALDHCKVAHNSVEPGHRLIVERLGQRGIFNLDMRLGEASGAAIAAAVVKAAVNCHNGMATFAEAGVCVQAESGR